MRQEQGRGLAELEHKTTGASSSLQASAVLALKNDHHSHLEQRQLTKEATIAIGRGL